MSLDPILDNINAPDILPMLHNSSTWEVTLIQYLSRFRGLVLTNRRRTNPNTQPEEANDLQQPEIQMHAENTEAYISGEQRFVQLYLQVYLNCQEPPTLLKSRTGATRGSFQCQLLQQ